MLYKLHELMPFANKKPIQTANIAPKTDVKMYKNPWNNFASESSLTTSRENAEKVVNPPKKPAINNKLAFSSPLSERRPYARPIANEPAIFTAKVPKGNKKKDPAQ